MMTHDLRRSVLRLVAIQVCLQSAMTGFRMGAPLLALKLGESPVAVGFLLALFALSQVVFALPAGRLTDRYGLHVALRLAVLMASAALVLSVLWPKLGVLCFSALVVGGANGLAVIAVQRDAGRLAQGPTALREVFSWLAIGPSLSNLVGPLLVGVLIDWVSFQAAFLAMALLPWLAWWLVSHVDKEPNSIKPEKVLLKSSWTMFREPAFRRLMLINWLYASCWDVHIFLVPVIGHEKGLSATVIGSLLASFALAATLVNLVIPWMASRLHEGRVVGCAMLATAVLFVLYPMAQSAWLMAGLSVLLGFALGSIHPMIMSTLHQITPGAQRGQALALRSMTISASSMLMPVVFGTVGTLVGVGVVFWVMAGVVGSGTALAFSLRTARPE